MEKKGGKIPSGGGENYIRGWNIAKNKEKGRYNISKKEGITIPNKKVVIVVILMQTENGFYQATKSNHNPNNYAIKPHLD